MENMEGWSDRTSKVIVRGQGQRPLRVLQVINSLVVGGAEQLLVSLARHVDRRVFDVQVCALTPPEDTPIVRDLRASGIPVYLLSDRREHDPRHAWRLARLIRRENVDVVHTHLAYADMVGAVAGKLAGRPVVSTQHHVSSVHDRNSAFGEAKFGAHAFALRHGVHRVIACAPEVLTVVRQELRVPAARVTVVSNGIDIAATLNVTAWEVQARRNELLGDGAGGPVVLAVGNLLLPKGHIHLVEAAALLQDRLPLLRVAIVGRREDATAQVEAAIAEYGQGERVRLLGQRRDIPALLAASDIFAMPSLGEGLPLALLEAMAAGKAVVATEVGGNPQVVVDGETGLLVPPADARALADAIAALANDQAWAARLASAGQARIARSFGVGPWVDRLVGIYEEAANVYGRRVPLSNKTFSSRTHAEGQRPES